MTGMKTDLFQSCGHCWVFQICWHTEHSTLLNPVAVGPLSHPALWTGPLVCMLCSVRFHVWLIHCPARLFSSFRTFPQVVITKIFNNWAATLGQGASLYHLGCYAHCLLCVHAKSFQLCLTLCDPMTCSLPDSSIHGDSLGKNTGVDAVLGGR